MRTRTQIRRTAWLLWLLHCVVAIVLCFIPLFDILGFERAFASGLVAAVSSPIWAVAVSRRSPKLTVGQRYFHALLGSLAMLVPSIVAGAIVELIKTPCSPAEGLVFFVLLGGGNAAFGSALGIAAALFRSRWMCILVGVGVNSALLMAALSRLYSEPQIFAYSIAFGYWPGSIYDEALTVSAGLWAFRAYSLALSLAIVFAVSALSDRGRFLRSVLLAALCAATAAFAFSEGGKLGFNLDRDTIREQLTRHVVSEHFEIYVDSNVSTERLKRIEAEHEFRWTQLKAFFGRAPQGRITSFVYRDVAQKQRLMGAGRTQIARPWAREVHTHGFDYPHRILKHELAHIFAAEFNDGPFRVPAKLGVLVDIGIVEGIAVAADWPHQELTIHGWTRAMRSLGLAPKIERIITPAGFWGVSSSRAYTTAGSFIRFLIERYGIERFGRLYASDDFEEAYGRPIKELAAEWEAFIDALPLPEEELVLAQHRFSRPSVFQKVCAHRYANVAQRGYGELNRGDLRAGAASMEELMRLRHNDVNPILALARAYAKAGDSERASKHVKQALERPRANQKELAMAQDVAGQVAWRLDDLEQAEAAFLKVHGLNLSQASKRAQAARVAALTRPTAMQLTLRSYLLGDLNRLLALVRLSELQHKHPDDALLQYLYGRALEQAGAWPEGVQALESADPLRLPPTLRFESRMTHGRLLLGAEQPGEAERLFAHTASTASTAAARGAAEDWRQRAEFLGRRGQSE